MSARYSRECDYSYHSAQNLKTTSPRSFWVSLAVGEAWSDMLIVTISCEAGVIIDAQVDESRLDALPVRAVVMVMMNVEGSRW